MSVEPLKVVVFGLELSLKSLFKERENVRITRGSSRSGTRNAGYGEEPQPPLRHSSIAQGRCREWLRPGRDRRQRRPRLIQIGRSRAGEFRPWCRRRPDRRRTHARYTHHARSLGRTVGARAEHGLNGPGLFQAWKSLPSGRPAYHWRAQLLRKPAASSSAPRRPAARARCEPGSAVGVEVWPEGSWLY